VAAAHQPWVRLESRRQAINPPGRRSWLQILRRRSLRVEEFSFSPSSWSGHSGLSSGYEEQAPLSWESKAKLTHKPADVIGLRRLRLRHKKGPRIPPQPFAYDLFINFLSSGRSQFRRSGDIKRLGFGSFATPLQFVGCLNLSLRSAYRPALRLAVWPKPATWVRPGGCSSSISRRPIPALVNGRPVEVALRGCRHRPAGHRGSCGVAPNLGRLPGNVGQGCCRVSLLARGMLDPLLAGVGVAPGSGPCSTQSALRICAIAVIPASRPNDARTALNFPSKPLVALTQRVSPSLTR
jgi:hypothetical protein